jgi:hypothetical protein
MAKRKSFYRIAAIAIISISLMFSLPLSSSANGIDRGVTMAGPNEAASQTPITYTINLTLPPATHPGFVFTDTLPGGIHFEIFECPNPPCPPNPLGDIPEASATPMTGTVPINQPYSALFAMWPNGVITDTLTRTYTFLIRAVPFLSMPAVITNTVTLPSDSNPANNSAMVVTRLRQPVPTVVPALRDWGMIVMICVLGVSAVHFLRRKKVNAGS